MEVKIQVDEDMFSEVLDKELKALSPECVRDIAVQCIGEYFRKNNYEVIDKIIMENDNSYYSKKPTDYTKHLLEKLDYSKLQDVADVVVKDLKTNYSAVLQGLMLRIIAGAIGDTDRFRNDASDVVRSVLRYG